MQIEYNTGVGYISSCNFNGDKRWLETFVSLIALKPQNTATEAEQDKFIVLCVSAGADMVLRAFLHLP